MKNRRAVQPLSGVRVNHHRKHFGKYCGLVPCLRGLFALGTVAMLSAHPAYAQNAVNAGKSADSELQLTEVVITASKHSESLSRAALAVSSVDQSNLDRSGIIDLTQVATQVPNLQISANGFSMRGLGSSNGTDQSFSTVAVHVDGVYAQRPEILSLAMYDVNRIEVLRGPQGTLYGRNATAGVINIVTNDPEKTFGVSGDLAYGKFNELVARGVVNLPVSDTLSFRVAYVTKTNDGYDSIAAPNGDRNYGIANNQTVRLTALWTPTTDFSWRLSASHSRDTGTTPYTYPTFYSTFVGTNFATGTEGRPSAPLAVTGTPFAFNANTRNSLDIQDNSARSAMHYAISDVWSASYVAGWSEFDNGSMLPPTPAIFFLQHNRATATSHELDLNYDSARAHGIVGLYYYHEKQDNSALLHLYDVTPYPWSTLIGGVGTLPVINPTIDILSHSPNRFSESHAAFGQLTFNLTEALRFTGGLRYSADKEGNDHQFIAVCAPGSATVLTQAQTCGVAFAHPDIGGLYAKSSNTSWKATGEYDLTSEVMLYGTISTGYRAGGVADKNAPVVAQTYQPEKVTNLELGLRTLWLDRSLSLNLTAFDMDYKNLQVTTVLQQPGVNPSPVTLNAAKATIRGVELETAWKATSADTLSGYLSALDAKFDSFPNGNDAYLSVTGTANTALTGAGNPPLALQAYDFSGNALPNAPRFSARVNYAHAFQLASGATLSPILSFYYQTKSYTDASNEAVTGVSSYTNTDMTLRYDSSAKNYFVEAYAYNLTDSHVISAVTQNWGLVSDSYLPPRRYGVRVGFKL